MLSTQRLPTFYLTNMTRRPAVRSPRVIAYMRVSTNEQETGIEVQRTTLEREVEYRGWTEVEWIEDRGHSARSLNRPGMERALALLASGQAGTLVASKLDRLSRSVADFADLMTRAEEQGWALIALDIDIDMTTPVGRFIAQVMASVTQLERELIGERTRAAMQEKKRQGVRLGAPRAVADEVVALAVARRAAGATLQQIANELTASGAKTRKGGRWWPSTVAGLLRSYDLDELAAQGKTA